MKARLSTKSTKSTSTKLHHAEKSRRTRRRRDSFPIVGVGASAGGLEAFERLLRELPADAGISFVLVQHLDPTRESHLAEILTRATKMTVSEAKDGMPVNANTVYVISPDMDMLLKGRSRGLEKNR